MSVCDLAAVASGGVGRHSNSTHVHTHTSNTNLAAVAGGVVNRHSHTQPLGDVMDGDGDREGGAHYGGIVKCEGTYGERRRSEDR
jgi:hypothetical protein